MGAMSMWHWLIVIALAVLLLGGRGKISELMGDVAKGVKSFKKGLTDDDDGDTALRQERAAPSQDDRVLKRTQETDH